MPTPSALARSWSASTATRSARRGPATSSPPAATVFFENLAPGRVRVRATFVKISNRSAVNSDGGAGPMWREDEAIYDPVVYRTFFESLDKTLFVMKSTRPESTADTQPE